MTVILLTSSELLPSVFHELALSMRANRRGRWFQNEFAKVGISSATQAYTFSTSLGVGILILIPPCVEHFSIRISMELMLMPF